LKTKTVLALGIALVLFLASLCVPAYLAVPYRNLMLALPKDTGSFGIDVFNIEEFNKEQFPLTYEISYVDRVSLPHADFQVTLTGTTSGYPQILGYSMVEGAFFTSQTWTGKLKHAVLNEKAAFEIFGSSSITGNRFRIRGDTWLVTGVIRDGNEDKSSIYVPSSVQAKRAGALAMKLSNAIDETFAKNSLKAIEVREAGFEFVSFNAVISLLKERIAVLLLGFIGFFFISIFRPLIIKFQKSLKTLRGELDRSYFKEIFQNDKKLLVNNFLPALGLAVLSVLTLIIFINIISICLPWQDTPSISRNYLTLFYPYLERIYYLELISRIIFIPSIVILAAFFTALNIKANQYLSRAGGSPFFSA
jgi:hypothetical protein